jgi:hypothetical protein
MTMMDGHDEWDYPVGQERHDVVELGLAAGAAEDIILAAVVLLAIAAATIHIVFGAWPRRDVPVPGTPTCTSRDPATVRDRPSHQQLRQMFTEARAQYDVWPSDYLEGVVSALHAVVYRAPFPGRRRYGEPTHSTMDARVHDYHAGRIAALAWSAGIRRNPPVHLILTEPTTPPSRSQHADPPNGW